MGYWAVVLVCVLSAIVGLLLFGKPTSVPPPVLDEVLMVVAISFPFLWSIVGSPPGFTALHYYRNRDGSNENRETATGPSIFRTGIEVTTAAVLLYALLTTILLTNTQTVMGIPYFEDGMLLRKLLSGPYAFVVENDLKLFALAVAAYFLSAVLWFVLWITR